MNHFSIVRRAVAVTLLALPLIVTAQDRGTRDEAKAMVDAAIGHIGKAGADQAFKDFADKANSAWHNKDLYVFVIRKDGIALSHGANPKLVGKDQTVLRDPNGKAFVQEMMEAAKKSEGGWVEYDWANPSTRKIEGKASFIKSAASINAFVGVGVYR